VTAVAASDLVDQARAIEHPLAVPGVSGVWGLEFGGQSFQATEAQLQQIRAGFIKELRRGLNKAYAQVEGGAYGHRDMIKIHEDQFIVSRISDTLGGVALPDLSIWDPAYQAIWRAQSELKGSQLVDAAKDTEQAQVSAQQAMTQFTAYREGTITGAERSVTTLEWTRDVSFAVAGIIATVATGGAGGILIGTAISSTGTVAQQAMEVHLDMRKEIDWRGVGVDAAISILLAVLGGKIAGKVLKTPAAASLGRVVVQRIVTNLLMGRAQAIVQTTFRTVVDNLAGEKNAMTGEQLAETLAHQMTDPKSLFMDILNGEMSQQIHAATVKATTSGGGGGGGGHEQAPVQEKTPPVQEQTPPVQEQTPAPVQEQQQPAVQEQPPPVAEAQPLPEVAVPEKAPFGPQELAEPSGLELDTARTFERPAAEQMAVADPTKATDPFGRQELEQPSGLKTGEGPKNPKALERGAPSSEPGGSEHRQGMAFHEWNAAEIERGLRIDYDPIAGRPRKVTYRVDPDVATAPGSDPRSYKKDPSTSGAQSSAEAYSKTGKELGHLAQLEAFKGGSPEAQEAANLTTNLVPMEPSLNRGEHDPVTGEWKPSEWRQSEERTVHEYAKDKSVIVEIEPIYPDQPDVLAKDKTPIPSAVRRRVLTMDGTVLEDKVHQNK
jgi:hypothetical protein